MNSVIEQPGRALSPKVLVFAALALLALCLPGAASAQWSAPDVQGNTSTAGSVAIGTTTPENSEQWSRVLDVYGTQHSKFSLRTGNIDGRVLSHDSGWWGAPAGMVVGTRTGHPLSFGTAGASRMTIAANGNVGIGTTAPTTNFHVVGDMTVTGSINAPGNTFFGGNVGVGTTTPENSEQWNKVLDVYAPQHSKFSLRTGNIDGRVLSHDSGWWGAPAGMVVGTRTGHPLSFGTGGASRMTIAANGNVGIGTTAPTTNFHVVGDMTVTGSINAPGNTFFGGNVGVGTAAPENSEGWSRVLDVVGGPHSKLSLRTTNIDGRVLSHDSGWWGAPAGMVVGTRTGHPLSFGTGGASRVTIAANGNVGIGTTAPTTNLHVVGDVTVTGNISAKYQDVAEWVPSKQKLQAGTVVVLDPERSNHVLASTASYDTAVAGVISEKPGLALGEAGEGKALVATTGRVKVRVDATRGAVKIGDLLVTSDVAGVAMKSQPLEVGGRRIHAPGTIIGKALEPLAGGTGEILVLLSLQ